MSNDPQQITDEDRDRDEALDSMMLAVEDLEAERIMRLIDSIGIDARRMHADMAAALGPVMRTRDLDRLQCIPWCLVDSETEKPLVMGFQITLE
jgi:hypothetical protein